MGNKCTEGLEVLVDEWRIWRGTEGLVGGELEEAGGVGKCVEKLAGGWRG